MTTFPLPTDPIVSIDAYLADGIAGSDIRRAHKLGRAQRARPVPAHASDTEADAETERRP
jgi:hypothetical protein